MQYESDLRSNEHYSGSSEKKAWKNFRPVRDLNPWSLRYRCSALPTELTSQLGAGHCWFQAPSNRHSNIWLSYIHSRLKLLQIQNSYLNLLTVNFLAIKKWTEENLRRFLVLEVEETLPWIIWVFEENLVVIFNQLKFACYADKTYCCFFKSARIF